MWTGERLSELEAGGVELEGASPYVRLRLQLRRARKRPGARERRRAQRDPLTRTHLEIDALSLVPAKRPVEEPADDSLAETERAHIWRVVEECGWRIRGPGNAADRLGLPESTLRYRMKKLGIRRPG